MVESPYGSDKAGLVCGYLFAPGRAGQAVESDAAAEHLAATHASATTFLWLHFSLTNGASAAWLRRHTAMPEAFYEASSQTFSTRVEMVDDALVAVLNDVKIFAAEASAAATVTLCVTDKLIVSARTTQLRAMDRLRASVKRGELFRSPAELLAHLLRDQADVLIDVVRDTTRQVDGIEDRILAHQPASRPMLGTLRRVLVRLQRLLTPEPAALFRLLNRPPTWLSRDDVSDLRQSAEELSTAVSESAALVERIRLLQEELVALTNEQTNQTLFILTVVTVLALPLTIIPGMFGMNVPGIPFSQRAAGFWLVMAVVLVVVGCGVVVARARYRR